MSDCCVELMTRAGRDGARVVTRGGAAGAAGGAVGAAVGDGLGLGVGGGWSLRAGSCARSEVIAAPAAGCLDAVSVCALSECWRARLIAPTLVATATAMRSAPDQEASRMAEGRL